MIELDRVFGEHVVERYANAVLADARAQLALGRHLRASLPAALAAYLIGRRTWSEEDQNLMMEALAEETERRLDAGDGVMAAARAGYLSMLSDGLPWREDILLRLREGVRSALAPGRSWRRSFVAGLAGDYLRLGCEPAWDENALAEMLAAIGEDFHVCVKRDDFLMAADRLALYRLLAVTGPTLPADYQNSVAISSAGQD